MHVVINISEEYFNAIKDTPDDQCTADMLIIKNGTLLPKGHGDLIDRDMLPTDYITDDDITDAFAVIEADKEVKE